MAIDQQIRSRAEDPQYAEHARAIGIVAAQWAILESELEGVYCAAFNTDYYRSNIAFYAIQNNNTRLAIVSATLKEIFKDEHLSLDWKRLERRYRRAASKRNGIVHAIWAEGRKPERIQQRQSISISGEYKRACRDWTVGDLLSARDQMARLAADLNNLQQLLRATNAISKQISPE